MRPRVLLADDHTMLLAAFETMLADDCDVVGQVSDGQALVAAARALRPDVIVLDVSMPVLNGLEAARQIRAVLPDVKLVFVTMNEDPEIAAEAMRCGASAYLLKRSAPPELLTAIREAIRGRQYITPLAAKGLMTTLLRGERRDAAPELTERQREILRGLSQGRSMKEVAAALNITARTVAFHKYAMMRALDVKSTAELIRYAMKHQVV